jgi:hypothetical protein
MTAPEAHGAQVLLDPDYRPKNVFHSYYNTGMFYILIFIMLSPKHMVEAAEPPQSHFGPHYPWFWVRARSRRSRPDQVDY